MVVVKLLLQLCCCAFVVFVVRTPCPALHIATSINRPKDVQGCPTVPEDFSFTAFLALLLFSRFSLCVCVCV